MLAAQLLMTSLQAEALTADERAFLADYPIGGICLFAHNIRDRYQAAELCAELRACCGEQLLIATDQEGGGVVRALDVPYPPSAMALGAAADLPLSYAVAQATARGLRALGINVDFAPVADVNNNPANPVIADRAFGADPQAVAAQVVAFVQGLQAEGVAATLKHFPGHGDTQIDSHVALPELPWGRERLEHCEFVPFRAGIAAGAAAVMSFHGLLPQLDPDAPATMSSAVMHGLLREHLGFDGVIFSDALNMQAIAARYSPAQAYQRCLAAGVDMPVYVRALPSDPASPDTRQGLQALETMLQHCQAAIDAGDLDATALQHSHQRLQRLARRYPASSNPEQAWRVGDEALLARAAQQAIVAYGTFPNLAAGSRLCVIAAERVVANAASDMRNIPVHSLVDKLRAAGFVCDFLSYGREQPNIAALQAQLPLDSTSSLLFVSSSRLRMAAAEKAWLQHIIQHSQQHGQQLLHIALWNPYHVADVDAPALISFGFRPASLEAIVQVLQGNAQPSAQSPISLK